MAIKFKIIIFAHVKPSPKLLYELSELRLVFKL